jgi:FkbM family methyltransferase
MISTSLYTSSLRSWLRRLGLIKLYGMAATVRRWRRLAAYRRNHPHSVDVHAGTFSATMLVGDAFEYHRVLSFKEDQHIIRAIVGRLRPGECYWDIGASLGLYSVLAAKAVGPEGCVIAFEPEKRSFLRLSENVAANGLTNIRPFQLALGRDRQQARLAVQAAASSGTHSLIAQKMGNAGGGFQPIEVVPGDELRKQENLPIPTALKVDVEGAEEDVLIGLMETLCNSHCQAVVCEVHFAILEAAGRSAAPKRILELLSKCGFTRQSWLDYSHVLACK